MDPQSCKWHRHINILDFNIMVLCSHCSQFCYNVNLRGIHACYTKIMFHKLCTSQIKQLMTDDSTVLQLFTLKCRNTRTIFALWNNYHIFSSSFNHNINEYRITPAAKEDTSHHTSVWYFFFCPLWKMLFLSNFCTIQFLQPNQFKIQYLPIFKSRFE